MWQKIPPFPKSHFLNPVLKEVQLGIQQSQGQSQTPKFLFHGRWVQFSIRLVTIHQSVLWGQMQELESPTSQEHKPKENSVNKERELLCLGAYVSQIQYLQRPCLLWPMPSKYLPYVIQTSLSMRLIFGLFFLPFQLITGFIVIVSKYY